MPRTYHQYQIFSQSHAGSVDLSRPSIAATAFRVTMAAVVAKALKGPTFHCIRFAVAVVVLTTAACTSITTSRLSDLDQITRVSVAVVEQHEPQKIIVVVPPSVVSAAADAIKAIKRIRTVVDPGTVPNHREFEIPPGYFLFRSAGITGDEAWFEGILGPLRRTTGPNDFQGCGAIFSVQLHKANGVWKPGHKQDGQWTDLVVGPTVC